MKKMKWMAVSVILLGSGWFVNLGPVSANRKEMTVEERVKEMRKKLDLNQQQETQVRDILLEKQKKRDEIIQDAHQKIRDLLTDEQKSKFNDLILKKEQKGD